MRKTADRGQAVEAAARGRRPNSGDLFAQGKVQGVLGLGGSAGTTIGTAAMRALPFGDSQVNGQHARQRRVCAIMSAFATSS